eukprot:SAG11_NODE_175_length_13457_cov_42.095673_11_plen_187_part_00
MDLPGGWPLHNYSCMRGYNRRHTGSFELDISVAGGGNPFGKVDPCRPRLSASGAGQWAGRGGRGPSWGHRQLLMGSAPPPRARRMRITGIFFKKNNLLLILISVGLKRRTRGCDISNMLLRQHDQKVFMDPACRQTFLIHFLVRFDNLGSCSRRQMSSWQHANNVFSDFFLVDVAGGATFSTPPVL